MGYLATSDPDFLGRTCRWIAEQHDVLVLIRYSHAGGSKDFEFFDSTERFIDRLRGLPPRTCVTVFGKRQLPLRGLIDESFITTALRVLTNGAEYLVVGLDPARYGNFGWFTHRAGETHEELREDLLDLEGRNVAVGTYPPWLEDGQDVISAVVPDPDGSITTGVY
jgi:hypothetical protein